MIGLTESGSIKKTELLDLREDELTKPESDWSLPSYLEEGLGNLIASEEGQFNYEGRHIATPFAKPVAEGAKVTDPIYFDNAFLSMFETADSHLRGGQHNVKEIREIIYRFAPGSYGHLWSFAKSDKGEIKGQYKGSIWGKEKVKVFLNISPSKFLLSSKIEPPNVEGPTS